jgi:hypothetical protein
MAPNESNNLGGYKMGSIEIIFMWKTKTVLDIGYLDSGIIKWGVGSYMAIVYSI